MTYVAGLTKQHLCTHFSFIISYCRNINWGEITFAPTTRRPLTPSLALGLSGFRNPRTGRLLPIMVRTTGSLIGTLLPLHPQACISFSLTSRSHTFPTHPHAEVSSLPTFFTSSVNDIVQSSEYCQLEMNGPSSHKLPPLLVFRAVIPSNYLRAGPDMIWPTILEGLQGFL